MSKNLNKDCFYQLPSGVAVLPCRLIQRDGTLMWKHALLHNNELSIPQEQATEQHIVKTAQRLEELNSWVSRGLEPWECLTTKAWFVPSDDELSTGISVYFSHLYYDINHTFKNVLPHIQPHEELELRGSYLFFKRC